MQDTSFSPDEIRKIIEKLKSDPAFRQKVLVILNKD
jgi:thymidylate synthase|nr:MAG TPA: Nif11 domain [Caudoviricetes sp.]